MTNGYNTKYIANMEYMYFQMVTPDLHGRKTDQHAKARNYYSLLHSKDVVYFLHFLVDIAAALPDVSTAFQRKEVTIGEIHAEIDACKDVIGKYAERCVLV